MSEVENTPSLRVALLALGFPPDVGGVELYNLHYARALWHRGHAVRVFAWPPLGDGDPAMVDGSHGFPVCRLPAWGNRRELAPGAVVTALGPWEPDVILVSRGSRSLGRVVAGVARRCSVVIVMHELRERHRGRRWLGRWRVRRRYGLDHAAAIVCNSRDTQERICALGVPEERTAIVYPGVDVDGYRPNPAAGAKLRSELGIGDRPMLLTVARLAANKGHACVLQALPALLERFPDLVYVVVGGGGRRAALEELAGQLGVAGAVRFVGRVDDPRPYYQATDVYVMVSAPQHSGANAGEGFGMAYVEAGACGKPVIASTSGGGAEIVVDDVTGLLVEPHDADGLCTAARRLLEDAPLRRRMGEAARERVPRYDWSVGAAALDDVLRGVVGARKAQG